MLTDEYPRTLNPTRWLICPELLREDYGRIRGQQCTQCLFADTRCTALVRGYRALAEQETVTDWGMDKTHDIPDRESLRPY